jgi:CheY-like chemotaxis protein
MKMSTMNRILLVDDEKVIRDCLSEMLSLMGFEVAVSSSGDEALNILHTRSFDLVLTDLEMPYIDGWTLALRIKEQWPHIPVVLITAAEKNYVMERIEESCVDYVLFKPFIMEEIQKIFKTIFEGDGASILNG